MNMKGWNEMSIAALIAAINLQYIQELLEEDKKKREDEIRNCMECGRPCSYGICDECPVRREKDE